MITIAAFVVHRGYYTSKGRGLRSRIAANRNVGLQSAIAAMSAVVGLIASAAYAVHPDLLAWGSLPLPDWVRFIGAVLAGLGFLLLQSAQTALGENWSDVPRILDGQSLTTTGPYRVIRHPIYAAFILILGSTLLIAANWFIGLAWITMTLLETYARIEREEALMLEYFGDGYRAYAGRTGRIFPRLFAATR